MIIPEVNEKQKAFLIADTISNILVGMSYPAIHALMNAELAVNVGENYARLISLKSVIWCISAMVYCSVWKKIQKRCMVNFFKFEIFESILLFTMSLFFMFKFNYIVYYLFDLLYGVFVGQIAGRTAGNLYNFLFANPQEKIDAGTANDFYCNLASLVGYGIALIDPLNIFVGAIYSSNAGIIEINWTYLRVCLICFQIADLFRTFAGVYTYCFRYSYTVWKNYFKSQRKRTEQID